MWLAWTSIVIGELGLGWGCCLHRSCSAMMHRCYIVGALKIGYLEMLME